MRITINLATRPFADIAPAIKRLRIAMGVLALLAIGLSYGLYALHTKAEEARARVRKLDDSVAHLQGERREFEAIMQRPDNAAVLTGSVNLNRLFDEKAFSWTLAMEDLETVLPGGVQVTTLEPVRDKTGLITLRLRVVGPRDKAVALVENLEHSKHFLLPRIVGESSEAANGPNERMEPVSESNRVNFDLLADYNAATLNEPEAKAAPKEKGDDKMEGKSTPEAVKSPAAPHAGGPGLRRAPVTGAGTGTQRTHGLPRTQPVPPQKPNPAKKQTPGGAA